MRRANLLTAVLVAVILAIAVAFAAYLLLHLLLPASDHPIDPKDLTQFAFTTVVGVGGVVALVVAYRRQVGIELGRFVERFGAAASQLGNPDVAVRLAGVYAMAGVADESTDHERQQCVDVLCGYLRLPYSPGTGANHEFQLEHKTPGRGGGDEMTHKYQYRQNDKEVRQTIVRVIAAHLQKDVRESWSDCTFDFTGAVLESADFSKAVFQSRVDIRGARFSGEWTSFSEAMFSGGQTVFGSATFSGERTSFDGATFGGKWTSFDGATFSGGWASFIGATFSGGWASFGDATFSGDWTVFASATFSGEQTSFRGVAFRGDQAWFDDATFSAVHTWFDDATFSGVVTSFRRADFGTGEVSFDNPKQWDPAPKFDWDASLPEAERTVKPANVKPESWPPTVRPPQP
ncbi:pentapeptide repeat-containing protein [Paeniglutamicibacter antarcticus]|uniref:Pentapeptide repeat-containing protein n=1 Tax=Arthrobacter terrae TaxID=2935737 RepID=A0A931G9L7_9MICC|nr:pentapeptide repeat-containing protein [Arthrobacter terrae]MBG0738807.1 pentapeptide repeat-containing protein [Arthrobacter terrae]